MVRSKTVARRRLAAAGGGLQGEFLIVQFQIYLVAVRGLAKMERNMGDDQSEETLDSESGGDLRVGGALARASLNVAGLVI